MLKNFLRWYWRSWDPTDWMVIGMLSVLLLAWLVTR
jgi:hypothetical protein